MDVAELIDELGRTPSATARATGLSRMTVHRLRDGVSSPTLATLRELALAAGYDIDVRLVPASDPAAAVAARVLAGPATPPLDHLEEWAMTDPGEVEAISTWVTRLERQGGHDPKRLLELAGRSSAPQHRKGALFFAPKPGLTQEQIVEIANSALGGLTETLSGVAAARVSARSRIRGTGERDHGRVVTGNERRQEREARPPSRSGAPPRGTSPDVQRRTERDTGRTRAPVSP